MTSDGLLLINLGTPASPATGDVRRYLREFLSDPRVLDIAAWKRSLLLNLVILPFRPSKSGEAYRKIWDPERGSPLLYHGQDLAQALQAKLADETRVKLAMRYQEPSIGDALRAFQREGIDRITVFPLFPHYASSSWGSAIEKLYAEAGKLNNTPSLRVLEPYYDHPAFVDAYAAITRRALDAFAPDTLLMSFHGLPERHMHASDVSGTHCLASASCCDAITTANRSCYRAQCYATARALATSLDLSDDRYEVAFQSRLGRTPWIQPYTDVRIQELARAGVQKLAVVVPSFTADCLETLEEIAIRGQEDFKAHGGAELRLIPCLNSEPAWVEAIATIVKPPAP